MILTELKIHSLRNISSAHLMLNPRFNVIIGPNGSGKTSILEALYLLSCGHSFRSREISPIISHDHEHLTVFARAGEETISIQKSATQPTQIKLNNQFCHTTSELAYSLPSQIFYSDIFQIIDAGSSVRRSLLDWGLFHVKHNYLKIWKEYRKALKQRNALLKTRAPYTHFIPWDRQLSALAVELDALRAEYFITWHSAFEKALKQLTPVPCSITYYRGWDKKNTNRPLEELLKENFDSDLNKTFTQYGPHQADIIIETEDSKAKRVLSRGQQKIILFALKLGQADLVAKDCLYLIDDLAAELDEMHQTNLMNYLLTRPGQYIITNTAETAVTKLIPVDQCSSFNMLNGATFSLSQNYDLV